MTAKSKIPLVDCLTNLAEYSDHYPPTDIYSEGWMLRCILDAYQRQGVNSPLTAPAGGKWFSEGFLATPFAPLTKEFLGMKDDLGESYTHADGVVGHFNIHPDTKARIELQTNASHFCVIEAKMFSPLSKGVSNATFYNQAARNVACIANLFCSPEQLSEGEKKPETELQRLDSILENEKNFGFIVAAPKKHLELHNHFSGYLDLKDIEDCVADRVNQYSGRERDYHKKKQWLEQWFQPFIRKISQSSNNDRNRFIRTESWENLIKEVSDPENKLLGFYIKCYNYNKPADLETWKPEK